MATLSEQELSACIKADKLGGLYYLYGKEIYLTNAYAQRLIKKALGDADASFNLQSYEGKGLSVSQLADAVEALPMFAARKCVVVRDLNADELSAGELDMLLALFADIPDTTVLVIVITGFEIDAKRRKSGGGKNQKLLAAAEKAGNACEFVGKSTADLARFIMDRAQRSGCSITRAGADYLSAACGGSLLQIVNELDKLCAFKQTGELTLADIDLLVAKQIDTSAFALAKAILSRNHKQAFTIIDELFYQRMEGIAILGALSMAFVDLYRAKAAITANVSEGQVIADFGYRGRDFAVRNAFRDVRRLPITQMRGCMDILVKADERLKSSRADERIVLEQVLVTMLAASEKEA